jgi:hypothetical protein
MRNLDLGIDPSLQQLVRLDHRHSCVPHDATAVRLDVFPHLLGRCKIIESCGAVLVANESSSVAGIVVDE